MRYYKIIITNSSGKVVQPAGEPDPNATYTSYYDQNGRGVTLAGARDIELDIPVYAAAQPAGNNFLRVWGVGLSEISQANNLAGMNIQVFGGMKAGLPLANPAQSGKLVEGQVFQCFGNWIGKEMTLDITISPGLGLISDPANIIFTWPKGSTLSDGIKQVLSKAFQGQKFTINVNINNDITLPEPTPGTYSTLEQFASWVFTVSKGLNPDDTYPGVSIVAQNKTITVDDRTNQTKPKQISFQDMLGQPTWITPAEIQVTFVMRADLSVLDYIQLPQAQVTTTQAGATPFGQGISQQSAFKGTFQISSLRHVGRYRAPTGDSWCTVANCTSLGSLGTSQQAA